MRVKIEENEVHHHFNRFLAAWEEGLLEEATTALEKAKVLIPGCPLIRRFLANCLLSMGRYKEGFTEKEFRFNFPLPESHIPGIPLWGEILPRIRACYKAPYWDGTENKTILVFCEGGFGDLIQNVRYLPQIKGKVILEVKPELVHLIQGIDGVHEVISSKNRVNSFIDTFTNRKKVDYLPPHDFVVSTESLSYFFDADLEHIPLKFPYIYPKIVPSVAKDKVLHSISKKRVGIVWAGNEREQSDSLRSCHLKHFHHLNKPGVQLFSLQKGNMDRYWGNLMEDHKVDFIDLGNDLESFNDTAQAIQGLDLIISVDTAVAHLAGALNKPVWLLASKKEHEWRWSKKWYNFMKIFRQSTLNDWDGLLKHVSEDAYFSSP